MMKYTNSSEEMFAGRDLNVGLLLGMEQGGGIRSTSVGRLLFDVLEIKPAREGAARTAAVSEEGCRGWSCQAGSPEEGRRGDLWDEGS